MMHNMKLSLKGAGKKKILREDTGLAATDKVLNEWHASILSLLNAINSNENAWYGLFSTFEAFSPIGSQIYPQKDSDALEFCASLSSMRKQLDSPPNNVESYEVAKQRIDITKKDLENLLARIDNAKAMQAKRIEVTREYRYYAEKTNGILEAGQKKSQGPTEKDVERQERNKLHVQNKSTELNSLTGQLFYEMDAIAVERLAATDRAMAAVLLLQYQYFANNPVSAPYAIASRIGLGRRVLIRDERRPWVPQDTPVKPAPETATPDTSMNIPGPSNGSWMPQHAMKQPGPSHPSPPPPPPPMGDTPMYAVPAVNPNLKHSPSIQPQAPMQQYSPMMGPMGQVPVHSGGYYDPSNVQRVPTGGGYYGQQPGYMQQQQSPMPSVDYSTTYGGLYQTPPPPPPPPPPSSVDSAKSSQSHPGPPIPATTGVQQSTAVPPPPGVEPPQLGTPSQGTFVLPESSHMIPGQSPAPIYTTGSSTGGGVNASNGSVLAVPPPPPPPPPPPETEPSGSGNGERTMEGPTAS